MNPFADLRFVETDRWRPLAVVAPELAVTADPDGATPTTGPVAPYAAVELDLGPVVGTVSAGLSDVRAVYDAARAEVRVELGGVSVRRRRLGGPFGPGRLVPGTTLGFALTESRVSVLARAPGERWRPLLTERDRVLARLDLRDPTVLTTQRWAWSGGSGAVRAVRHGPFGMLGVRDPQLVRHADGSAYVEDGRVFATWTCAGPGGFRSAHWGVFAIDLDDPGAMVQTAHLYSRRGSRVHGDHAGALVRDGDRWLVTLSSWGDFSARRGVHARGTTSTADLLRGEHVLDTEALDLPVPTGTSTWDPSLRRAPGGEGWLLAHVAAPCVDPFRFHPALARTNAPDPFDARREWVRVGAADHLRAGEGPVLVERDGRTWLVASDGDARRFLVLDAATVREVGALDAAYPSNIPHPQLVRRDDGSWLMLTFDGTRLERRRRENGRRPVLGYGTHGDAIVMRAGPTGPRGRGGDAP